MSAGDFDARRFIIQSHCTRSGNGLSVSFLVDKGKNSIDTIGIEEADAWGKTASGIKPKAARANE